MNLNKSIFESYKINEKELIDQLKPSIIAIYGEKHKPLIEKRLNTIMINIYITYEDIKNEYLYNKSHIENGLSLRFLKQLGVSVSAETEEKVYAGSCYDLTENQRNIMQSFFEANSFKKDFGPIFDFDETLLENANEWTRNRIFTSRCKILKSYGLDISLENYDEVISTPEGMEAMKQVQKVYAIVQELKQEYIRWEESHARENSYLAEGEKIRQELNFEYLKKFYHMILPYVSEEESQNIQKALEEAEKEGTMETLAKSKFTNTADPNQMYYRYGDWDDSILGAFQEKYNMVAHEDNYTADKIRKNRIQYFKLKGLDLGEEYDSYEKSEEAIRLWPDKEVLKIIADIDRKCSKERDTEFLLKTSNYSQCKEDLAKLNLCLEDDFDTDFVKKKTICISPNVVRDDKGNYKKVNILHLPILQMLREYKDVLFVHEVTHVVELSLKQLSDTQFLIKTGFDTFVEELKTDKKQIQDEEEQEDSRREFEILSENLHQNIAMAVTDNLHKKGIYLLDDPKTSKITGGSDYERFNVITASFIQNFHAEIIDGMILPEMKIIYDAIGKQNLEELNHIVAEYGNLPYYKMMTEVINKQDTELVRKRNNLIKSAKENAEQMQIYKKEHTLKNSGR